MTTVTPEVIAREQISTLRNAINSIKQEAKHEGATRTVALALELIELVLRSQQTRLRTLEDVTMITDTSAHDKMRQEHFKTLHMTLENIKSEATKGGTTHTIANALGEVATILRDNEERLKKLEAIHGSK